MPRKKEHTTGEMIDALKQAHGRVHTAAQLLGCHETTVYRYIKNYPTVEQAQETGKQREVDIVELELMKSIRAGNVTAIIFYLKTQGKDRGWVERLDIGLDLKQLKQVEEALRILDQKPSDFFEALIAKAASIKHDVERE